MRDLPEILAPVCEGKPHISFALGVSCNFPLGKGLPENFIGGGLSQKLRQHGGGGGALRTGFTSVYGEFKRQTSHKFVRADYIL